MVLGPGEIISSTNVSPIPGGWEVFQSQMVPWKGAILRFKLFSTEEVAEDASLLVGAWEKIFHSEVSRWDFGSVVGGVSDFVGPGVFWNTPVAFRFDTEVVGTSDDSEITVLTVVSTPGVSDEPVWDVLLNTVTDDRDGVVEFLSAGSVVDDTTLVVDKTISIEGADDWTSLINFVHDSFFTRD